MPNGELSSYSVHTKVQRIRPATCRPSREPDLQNYYQSIQLHPWGHPVSQKRKTFTHIILQNTTFLIHTAIYMIMYAYDGSISSIKSDEMYYYTFFPPPPPPPPPLFLLLPPRPDIRSLTILRRVLIAESTIP